MDMKLEVVVLPVSDVDRAKEFYKALGWREDADFAASADFRVVQLTPPGSACSVIFGTGVSSARPGSAQGLQLTVSDIDQARAELAERGAEVSEVFHDAGGVFHHAGTAARVPGPAPEHKSYGSFASFSDPDGNGWLIQEITTRLPAAGPAGHRVGLDRRPRGSAAPRRPAAVHGEHEVRTGAADPDWPDWCADHMVREQAGTQLPS